MLEDCLVVVPARLDSVRLPRKPLLDIHGKPMIVRVVERLLTLPKLKYVVATDSVEIFDVCKTYGFNVELTSKSCKNGTERVAEIASRHPYSFFCNIQGDEPLLNMNALNKMLCQSDVNEKTFYQAVSLLSGEDKFDDTEVKAIMLEDNKIIYLSRANIPFVVNDFECIRYRCLGLYLYSRELLKNFVSFNQGSLEKTEQIEQLRCIEHGLGIKGVVVPASEKSVDTVHDLEYMNSLDISCFEKTEQ